MPVFEQGYRPYSGPVKRSSRALAIAWESIRPRMRWWVWVVFAMFCFWPWFVFAAVTFITLSVQTGITRVPVPPPADIFRGGSEIRPESLLGMMSGQNPAHVFWETLNDAFAMGYPVYITAIAAAGLLAADRRTGAIQIYLARPVSRRDYFVGKLAAAAFFGLLVTALPACLYWLECALLSEDRMYALEKSWILLSIAGAAAAYALWSSALVLFWSSLLARPALVGIASTISYIVLLTLGTVFRTAMDRPEFGIVSPGVAVGGLVAPLFGLELPEWLPWTHCLAAGLGLPALLLWVVHRRLRAVEVVT
ncbi:MAG: hypothetical protein HMLKMBBP_03598 [Planctomycetes bacterium]|nr:hypothetical protein [Planctomycetota bacterium]